LNPRYFTDGSGKAIYLTGSHTWANLQEITGESEPAAFDYEAYLDFLVEHNHNFIRLWNWEHAYWASWAEDTLKVLYGSPNPFPRTGPGAALDGRPKFDLDRFNQAYFDRLRGRVAAAGQRGIYVMIMLFEGFSVEKKGRSKNNPSKGNPWKGHPFNGRNNINGVDGDLDGNGEGQEIQTLADPAVTSRQKAYIRKVVDTVNDLDNVLYEICNESDTASCEWQYELIDYIHHYEAGLEKQHPVVMTVPYPGGDNRRLFASNAEAISPNRDENNDYRHDPPAADGSKVILSDTDHLWGIGGTEIWVWKSFLRGLNPIFMDPYEALPGYPSSLNLPELRQWKLLRRSMGYTRYFALRMNLVEMVPHGELASTGYCLANPEGETAEYLVYLPEGGSVAVDLSATRGKLSLEWFNPALGAVTDVWRIEGGAERSLTSPFSGHAVCYIHPVP